jgi:hypothetical protein
MNGGLELLVEQQHKIRTGPAKTIIFAVPPDAWQGLAPDPIRRNRPL